MKPTAFFSVLALDLLTRHFVCCRQGEARCATPPLGADVAISSGRQEQDGCDGGFSTLGTEHVSERTQGNRGGEVTGEDGRASMKEKRKYDQTSGLVGRGGRQVGAGRTSISSWSAPSWSGKAIGFDVLATCFLVSSIRQGKRGRRPPLRGYLVAVVMTQHTTTLKTQH